MLKFLILLILPQIVFASIWQDLWFNKNQQGSHLLTQKKNDEAAKTFTDKNWKGIAYYRSGNYQEAYNEFKQDNSAQGLYNQGNALAHMQKYQEAIDAYNKSLKLQGNSPDTTYNKQLVEKLLKQQQQNNQDQKQSDKDKSQQNSDQKQSQNKQNSSETSKQNKQQNSEQQSNAQDKQQNKTEQSNSQNKQNNQQQNSGNRQSDDSKTQSDTKNPAQDSVNQDKNSEQAKQNQQQANADKPENSVEQKPQDALNKQQAAAQNSEKPDSDKNVNEQIPSTNYMRAQTPVDIEVKSALSQIPDDPGGLLRNKFLRDYQNQKQDGNNE